MRKYAQITIVMSVLFFLVWLRNVELGTDETFTAGIKPKNPALNATGPTSTLTPQPTQKNTGGIPTATPLKPTSVPVQAGQYRNGAYTGSVADAFYGNIQVRVVISGGQITDVIFLQYPNDNNTSRNINSQAMPLLKQEAIAAQSANVSGVSGASATSPAFQQSLASALSQAK